MTINESSTNTEYKNATSLIDNIPSLYNFTYYIFSNKDNL